MKTLLLLTTLFISLNIYSQELIYKVSYENRNDDLTIVIADSVKTKNIYHSIFNQQINIKEAFSNGKLYFKHENEKYTLVCELYYIDEYGKIKKFKKKLFKNKIKQQY